MDQRLQFVSDYQRGMAPMTELCARYAISRKTGYKWIGRYADDGPPGLLERSRRPHACPHASDPLVMEALLELRRRHPRWGPKSCSPYCTGVIRDGPCRLPAPWARG